MPETWNCNPEPLDAPLEFLANALADIPRGSCHAHARRVGRMAVAFVPHGRARAALDDEAIPLGDFRLIALGFKWCDNGRGGMVARQPLAVYRAVADRGGTGRIRLVCQRAYDLRSPTRGIAPDPLRNPRGCRDAIFLHQAVEDAMPTAFGAALAVPQFFFAYRPRRQSVFEPTFPREVWEDPKVGRRIGSMRAWPAAMFVRPRGQHFDFSPVDGTPDPWAGGDVAPTAHEHAGWFLDEGVPCPRAQVPDAVYASFPPQLRDRTIRNPAWAVLRHHGVLADGPGHRAWIDALGRPSDGARRFPAPTRPGSRTARVRAAIEAFVSEQPGRQDVLMRHLRDACRAMGIALPRDARGEDDFLVDLLDSPWLPVEAPGLGAVQLIADAGEPAASSYSDGVAEVDFDDLGDRSRRYESLPRHVVREALLQRFGRKRSAPRGHHGAGGRRGASPVVAAAPRPGPSSLDGG
jgi:hypothetical protein